MSATLAGGDFEEQRWTITREQWKALRPGDILEEVRSRTPRMVLQVHFGRKGALRDPSIQLYKLRESWTPCPVTVLFFNDACYRLRPTGKRGRVPPNALDCYRHGKDHYR